ncbi:MAG TPA: Ig-like domain-containing protein [Longimicrobium sp.]|jgi:hypothetical protein
MKLATHPLLRARGAALRLGATFLVLAACDGGGGVTQPGPEPTPEQPRVSAVKLSPSGQAVQAGATLQFQATETMSDGSAGSVELTWSATGGTVTQSGLFTAGASPGSYTVTATAPNGVAGSASGTVTAGPPSNPTLTGILVTPNGASVQAGATQQYQAVGQLSSGGTSQVAVTWSATGGTISAGGVYTAGSTAGSFKVTATGPGGVSGSVDVTVTTTPPPPPPPAGSYQTVVGDDWRSYQNKDQLKAREYFWWFRSEDVYQDVDLVADPTFGQAVRIRFRQSDEAGFAPRLSEAFPAPLDKMWYRWRMKYSPGWTDVGPNPAGYANAYKVSFWLWEGYDGRGGIELTSTDDYVRGWAVNQNGTWLSYNERQLPGTQNWSRAAAAWNDNEWWEFVVYYERLGPSSARQHWWKRRLTNGGAIANNAWEYAGIEVSGNVTPRARGIDLGANKNKSTPQTQYIYWGPWEVVDGSKYPNPFGMTGF